MDSNQKWMSITLTLMLTIAVSSCIYEYITPDWKIKNNEELYILHEQYIGDAHGYENILLMNVTKLYLINVGDCYAIRDFWQIDEPIIKEKPIIQLYFANDTTIRHDLISGEYSVIKIAWKNNGYIESVSQYGTTWGTVGECVTVLQKIRKTDFVLGEYVYHTKEGKSGTPYKVVGFEDDMILNIYNPKPQNCVLFEDPEGHRFYEKEVGGWYSHFVQ